MTLPGTRFFDPDGNALPKTGSMAAETRRGAAFKADYAFDGGTSNSGNVYCSAQDTTSGWLRHAHFPSSPRRFHRIEGGRVYQKDFRESLKYNM